MQAKKIGKWLVLLVSGWVYAQPTVTLQVTDDRGAPLKQVVAGAPFEVQVIVDEASDSSAPIIQGFDAVTKLNAQTSNRMTMINGQTSTQKQFLYTVQATNMGTITIGPAVVIHQGTPYQSNAVTITVGQQTQRQQSTQSPLTISLAVDKQRVVLGEPVILTITIMHDPNVQLSPQMRLELERHGWKVKSQQAMRSQKTSDGHAYQVLEQKIELYASEPGMRLIPAAMVQGIAPVRTQHRQYSFFDFDDLFGRRGEQVTANSNAIAVEVVPLPNHTGPVHAVGQSMSIRAVVDQTHATVGEGIVFKLEVEGSGDAQSVSFPTLSLPEQLTSYESKSDIHERETGSWKKTFEYIVQAREPGELVIPPQHFTYFDIADRKYKTRTTSPISLTIEPGTGVPVLPVDAPEQLASCEPIALQEVMTQEYPLFSFPRRLFLGIWLLLVAGMVGMGLWRVVKRLGDAPQRQRARAFKQAKLKLKQARAQGNVTVLYSLLVDALAQRFNRLPASLSEQEMVELLQRAGMTTQQCDQWKDDFALFTQAAFYTSAAQHKQQLFDRAQYWLGLFEKMV